MFEAFMRLLFIYYNRIPVSISSEGALVRTGKAFCDSVEYIHAQEGTAARNLQDHMRKWHTHNTTTQLREDAFYRDVGAIGIALFNGLEPSREWSPDQEMMRCLALKCYMCD